MIVSNNTGFRYLANVPPMAIGPQLGQAEGRAALADALTPLIPALLFAAGVVALVWQSGQRRTRSRR